MTLTTQSSKTEAVDAQAYLEHRETSIPRLLQTGKRRLDALFDGQGYSLELRICGLEPLV